MVLALAVSVVTVVLVNLFLPQIVEFFLHEQTDLWPLRVFSIAPVILSVSVMIASNVFIAFGKNNYMLKSMIVTTVAYVVLLFIIWSLGLLSNMYAFIIIAVGSYAIELVYRLVIMNKIANDIEVETNTASN